MALVKITLVNMALVKMALVKMALVKMFPFMAIYVIVALVKMVQKKHEALN